MGCEGCEPHRSLLEMFPQHLLSDQMYEEADFSGVMTVYLPGLFGVIFYQVKTFFFREMGSQYSLITNTWQAVTVKY